MTDSDALEFAILDRVAADAPVSLEDLQQIFGHDGWNRLFATIDRLSRMGLLTIRRVDRSTYLISLGPRLPTAPRVGRPDSASSSAAVQS